MGRNLIFVIATMLLLNVAMSALNSAQREPVREKVPYSQFLNEVKSGAVRAVRIDGQRIVGDRVDGGPFATFAPDDPGLVGDLIKANVDIDVQPPVEPSLIGRLLVSAFPILLLIGVWIWFMRRQGMAGGRGGGVFSFGKSRARRVEGDSVKVTLADVAGVDEAKEDVGELVEFLRDPSRFRKLGGNIPRGVLLVGPPGTGKTLLARAVAGEAGVPFFTVSGSDFVEMFVGVGASRVRDLFADAKKNAPCIVFVDEIDAVGRRRGAGLGGGHDEREQTLNQLLVEMDGFEGTEGVIVIAATNRPDVLDPALLRPGRFDRQVVVPLPDVQGRADILKIHMRRVPLDNDVDPSVIARGTPGFSGADLANLVNEAALLAARSRQERVDMAVVEQAKDKILMGAERRSMIMSEDDKRLTAYHEAGHAIVGRLVPEHDPVHKVSIIPRGRALGVTLFLPERDHLSASRQRLESMISSLYGGRVAEEIVFGRDAVTTGASNDIERATQLARDMVTRYGLSDAMGPLCYEEEEGEVFLGRSVTQRQTVSDETAKRIDAEVRAIIDRNYARARDILTEHRDVLDRMAEALVLHETISSEQIDALMGCEPVERPAPPGDGPQGPDANESRPRRSSGRTRPAIGPPIEQT